MSVCRAYYWVLSKRTVSEFRSHLYYQSCVTVGKVLTPSVPLFPDVGKKDKRGHWNRGFGAAERSSNLSLCE